MSSLSIISKPIRATVFTTVNGGKTSKELTKIEAIAFFSQLAPQMQSQIEQGAKIKLKNHKLYLQEKGVFTWKELTRNTETITKMQDTYKQYKEKSQPYVTTQETLTQLQSRIKQLPITDQLEDLNNQALLELTDQCKTLFEVVTLERIFLESFSSATNTAIKIINPNPESKRVSNSSLRAGSIKKIVVNSQKQSVDHLIKLLEQEEVYNNFSMVRFKDALIDFKKNLETVDQFLSWGDRKLPTGIYSDMIQQLYLSIGVMDTSGNDLLMLGRKSFQLSLFPEDLKIDRLIQTLNGWQEKMQSILPEFKIKEFSDKNTIQTIQLKKKEDRTLEEQARLTIYFTVMDLYKNAYRKEVICQRLVSLLSEPHRKVFMQQLQKIALPDNKHLTKEHIAYFFDPVKEFQGKFLPLAQEVQVILEQLEQEGSVKEIMNQFERLITSKTTKELVAQLGQYAYQYNQIENYQVLYMQKKLQKQPQGVQDDFAYPFELVTSLLRPGFDSKIEVFGLTDTALNQAVYQALIQSPIDGWSVDSSYQFKSDLNQFNHFISNLNIQISEIKKALSKLPDFETNIDKKKSELDEHYKAHGKDNRGGVKEEVIEVQRIKRIFYSFRALEKILVDVKVAHEAYKKSATPKNRENLNEYVKSYHKMLEEVLKIHEVNIKEKSIDKRIVSYLKNIIRPKKDMASNLNDIQGDWNRELIAVQKGVALVTKIKQEMDHLSRLLFQKTLDKIRTEDPDSIKQIEKDGQVIELIEI